jgi:molybdopterin-containing oxidoreductase family membrane subunit
MNAVFALYANGDSAGRAVNALRSAGVADGDITVISSEPLERYEFGQMNRATWIWYIASAGGFAGLVVGAWLTRMTELAWPLSTGNMPIVSWWPNLIIMFELTMLGGILATVATLLVSGRLVRRMPRLYDRAVSEGKILVGVETPSGDIRAIEAALRSGATEIKRVQ